MGESPVHPDHQAGEDEEGGPQGEEGIDPPLRPHLLGVLVDLVVGDDEHDRDEDSETRRASLGRHCQSHREQRHEQHHRHLDHPEVEIGADRVAALPREAGIAAEPPQLGHGQLLGAVAAAAEIADRRKVDRQIVLDEAQHARDPIAGLIVNQPAVGEAEEDRLRIVGGEEAAAIGADRDGPPAALGDAQEDSVKIGAVILAALDAQRHPAPETGELADLDRRAERARAQLVTQILVGILGVGLKEADDPEIEHEQDQRVAIGNPEQAPVAEPHGAQRIELRGQSELPEGEQDPEREADRDREAQIFGDQIGEHPPHDGDGPSLADDEIEQAKHPVHQQQHRREAERADQRNEDQPGQIAVDLVRKLQASTVPTRRLARRL